MQKSQSAGGFKMNVNKDNKGGSTPVAKGLYQARAVTKATTTKDGSKQMMSVEYNLQGKGPDGKSVMGRKVFDNVTYEESMIWKWNLLYNVATGEDLPDGDFTFDELYSLVSGAIDGKVLSIEVEVQVNPSSGKEGNKVAKVFA